MSYVTWKLEYEKYNTSSKTYDPAVALTDFGSLKLSGSIGDGKDSFGFTILNYNGTYNESFNPNDRITIYRAVNSLSVTTDDLLMVGAVRDAPDLESYNKSTIKVNGYNYSETIMNALVFVDAKELDPVQTIKQALQSAKVASKNFSVTWHPDNPTVKSTGGSFPNVGEFLFYKTFNDILEKVSGDTKTGDGNYYWYVDKNNYLIWRKRKGSTASSPKFNSSTDEYNSITIKKDLKDVINYVIVKGGQGPNGKPIQVPVADYPSVSKNGFKYYIMVDETKTAQSNLDADRVKAGNVDSMKDGVNWAGGFIPSWTTNTYTSYSDYVTAFRSYVKTEILEPLGYEFLEVRSKGKLKVDIQRPPHVGVWNLGDVIKCTIPQLSTVEKDLRVESLNYSSDMDEYSLVEDIGSI